MPSEGLGCYVGGDEDPLKVIRERDDRMINFYKGHPATMENGLKQTENGIRENTVDPLTMQGLGVPTPGAGENPHTTFDSPKT